MLKNTGPSDEENDPGSAAAENAEHDPATQEWLRNTEAMFAETDEINIHKANVEEQMFALKQAVLRGDKVALSKIYETANVAIIALEELRAAQSTLVSEFAAQKLTWPVGFAAHQNLQSVQNAYKNLVKDLKLGTKIDSVVDAEPLFKKYVDQNVVREFVVGTLKRIEWIRRRYREGTRLAWYHMLRSGQPSFAPTVACNNDPIARRRIEWALKLPPLEKKRESSDEWVLAVKELLVLEYDGFPEKNLRFRACGESRARSKASSWKSGMKNVGELRDKSFDANIKDAIFAQVKKFVLYLAPSEPTEVIDDYLPPKERSS